MKKTSSQAITTAKKEQFLNRLKQTGVIREACRVVGIDQATPHWWAKRSKEFMARLQEAKSTGEKVLLGELQEEIRKRALAGRKDPGSANLLMFQTKKLDPSYRENAPFNIQIGPALIMFGPDPSLEERGDQLAAEQRLRAVFLDDYDDVMHHARVGVDHLFPGPEGAKRFMEVTDGASDFGPEGEILVTRFLSDWGRLAAQKRGR